MTQTVQGAQSFARNLAVLQLIADSSVALGKAELLELCDLTRPTLYRVIAALEAEGLIQATVDKRYRLGGRLVALARQALAQSDVRKIAEPILTNLRDASRETVHLAIPSGNQLIYIDKIESLETVRMSSTIGTRVCYHSSSVGKAFLSALPSSEAEQLIADIDLVKITAHTKTSALTLKKVIREARRAGFVRDYQENEIGIVCFGAAVVDVTHRPVAAVSVSVPLFRLADDNSQYTAPLLKAVSEISLGLGLTT